MIVLSANCDKIIQSISSIKTNAYGANEEIIYKIRRNQVYTYNKAKRKIDDDDVTKENLKDHNLNWPRIPGHTNGIIKIRGSRSGKTNTLLELIKRQDDDNYSVIDKNLFIC